MTPGFPALPAAARVLAVGTLILASAGCAVRTPPAGTPTAPAVSGYRALFRVEARRGDERARFRIAAALRAPDAVRLEFFGPVGGARAVLIADAMEVLVIIPGDRVYDRSPATPENLSRILGLPVSASHLAALLTGRPFCPPETVRDRVETQNAATFARTIAWHAIDCPPGEVLYQARGESRGVVREASIRDAGTGAIILRVEYEGGGGTGESWPSTLRLRFERDGAEVVLKAEEGPIAAPVNESLFVPSVPAGFERKILSLSLSAPALHGSAAEAGE